MRFLSVIVFMALLSGTAGAAVHPTQAHPQLQSSAPAAPVSQLTPEQQQAVKSAEAYLNTLSTLRATFVQTANDGRRATGTFYLNRPGKMRIDYNAPSTDFIVADGLLIYYYDGEMKQQSSTIISKSLADFFLRKNLKLSGDISVSDLKRGNNTIEMTLVQTSNPLAGSLTLTLSESPLQLQKWRVVDAQGLVTEVKLQNIETGIVLDGSLFHYYDPAHKAHLYNGN